MKLSSAKTPKHDPHVRQITTESTMKKSKFSLARKDAAMEELISKTDHQTLAIWAIDCAERVLPYFEEQYPEDKRPRQAIEALQTWLNTGVFKIAVIRKA